MLNIPYLENNVRTFDTSFEDEDLSQVDVKGFDVENSTKMWEAIQIVYRVGHEVNDLDEMIDLLIKERSKYI